MSTFAVAGINAAMAGNPGIGAVGNPAIGSMGGNGSASNVSSGIGHSFSEFVRNTNQQQTQADQAVQQLVEGKTDNVQQVVLAMAQAEMSFQLFMEVRNKLTDTYNELMRMQF